jgi:hypothetical protein
MAEIPFSFIMSTAARARSTARRRRSSEVFESGLSSSIDDMTGFMHLGGKRIQAVVSRRADTGFR